MTKMTVIILGILPFFLLFAGHAHALDTLSQLGHESAGAGLTSANIDDDPRPDIFFAWVEVHSGTWDKINYVVAKNLDNTFKADWNGRICFSHR